PADVGVQRTGAEAILATTRRSSPMPHIPRVAAVALGLLALLGVSRRRQLRSWSGRRTPRKRTAAIRPPSAVCGPLAARLRCRCNALRHPDRPPPHPLAAPAGSLGAHRGARLR